MNIKTRDMVLREETQESCFGRPGDIHFAGDINVSWGQAQLDVVVRAGDAAFHHRFGLGDVVGVVSGGGEDGRNGPLIARHECDIGSVHGRLLAVERLVRVGHGARLWRPARRCLVAAARAVMGGEEAVDAVEQGAKAGQASADDAEVMLRFGPISDWNVGVCCAENSVISKIVFQRSKPKKKNKRAGERIPT